MAIYLGLGSNQGNLRDNLRSALALLAAREIEVRRISPVVETPAMLPPAAPPEWNLPFLNLVVECRSALPPEQLLATIKQAELELGRAAAPRWSPRSIDIDILLHDDRVVDTAALTIPHPGLHERAFFLTPLAALQPDLRLPGLRGSAGKTALEAVRRLGSTIPLWMGIINLTPDSFSDGGLNASDAALDRRIDEMIATGVHILDFGAESTRPGASPLTPEDEWSRLAPVLERAIDRLTSDPLRPLVSVDTYHPEVAKRALSLGADMINDVSGLTQAAMIELAAESTAAFVAMHNLGLPADRDVTLGTDRGTVDQIDAWLDNQLARWQAAGITSSRLIFDPGIGFGKSALQSLEILRGFERFANRGIRILIGHSRKSFMQSLGSNALHDRDLLTIGSSLSLCARGVDILRVHNVADHARAYRGWAHTEPPPGSSGGS